MISKVAAGGGAVALTAFAIGVSLRHGIFVAGLAFVGGFASPAIIGSETPNTPVLFGYLLAIAAGTLWRHPPARLVAARLGRAGGSGDLDGALDDVAGRRPALGRAVPGRRGRPVRLGDVAAAGRRRTRPIDVAALVWAALGVTGVLIVALIVQDDGEQTAGWLALAAHGIGLFALARWTPRFQYVAALAPLLSIAALALWRRHADRVRRDWPARSVRRPLRRGGLRPAVERGPARLLGGAGRRRGARAFPALPGTCCAASPTARRGA